MHMNSFRMKNYNTLQIVVLLFPFAIINIKHLSEVLIFILVLYGVNIFRIEKASNSALSQLKLTSLLPLGFFVSIAASVLLSNNPEKGIHTLGSYIHFLIAPLVAYAIYKSNISLKEMIPIIKISIVAGAAFAMYQTLYLNRRSAEAGADASTIFGFIMIFFAFISILDLWSQTRRQKIISIGVFSSAMYASILSGTRISWIMFFCLIPLIYLLWTSQKLLTTKRLLLFSLTLSLIVVSAYSNPHVRHRISLALDEANTFSTSKDAEGSVDLRLAMWSGGWLAFQQQPLIGYGHQNTGIAAANHIQGENAKDFIKGMKMLHNDYMNALVGFGIFGLFSFLAFLLIPLWVCLKRLSQHEDFTKNAAGVIFSFSLIIFAITDSIHSHNVMRSLVVFFWPFFLIRGRA